jgi:hypothetical protein
MLQALLFEKVCQVWWIGGRAYCPTETLQLMVLKVLDSLLDTCLDIRRVVGVKVGEQDTVWTRGTSEKPHQFLVLVKFCPRQSASKASHLFCEVLIQCS